MDAKTSARIIRVALAHGFLQQDQLGAVLSQAGSMKSYDLIDFMVEKGMMATENGPKLVELLAEDEEKGNDSGELVLEKKLKEFESGLKQLGKSKGGKRALTAEIIRDRSINTVGMQIGNYEVLEEIARGSMGAVFQAKPLGILDVMAKGWGLADVVALKVMLTGANEKNQEEVQRFRDECKALINLDHKNIIKVYDLGEEEGLWYYAMELIKDEDVRILFAEGKPPPVTMALSLIHDLAEAMSQVHKAGILHRDIKPSNVLLDRSCHPYRPVLIDFGLIAEMTDEKGENLILGTPNYMPPEQARPSGGVRVGRYSDVYALGATLYFLLTGKPPFSGWTARGIIKQVLNDAPRSPEELRPGIPPEVVAICMKCLEKLPKDRYRTCKELVKDIDRFLSRHRMRLKLKNFWRKLRRTLFGKK